MKTVRSFFSLQWESQLAIIGLPLCFMVLIAGAIAGDWLPLLFTILMVLPGFILLGWHHATLPDIHRRAEEDAKRDWAAASPKKRKRMLKRAWKE